MNIKAKLLEKGFLENVDYTLSNTEIIALPKTRQVEQIISHPEILEVIGQDAHGIIPAEFDAQGVEISPMIPAQVAILAVALDEQQILLQAAIAWQEL